MTSSQPTYDVMQHDTDVNTCENEQVFGQLQKELLAAVSQLQQTNSELVTAVTQLHAKVTELEATNFHLQTDVAGLNTTVARKCAARTGKLNSQKCYT